jgi:MAP/microtubule affinity-regulating kinase
VDREGNLKLIDFGFATIAPKGKLRLFCGTPSYMSPEIVQKKEYRGGPADVWAVGVVLYVLATGSFPFKSPIERELYRKITKGLYVYPQTVPNSTKRIIDKML